MANKIIHLKRAMTPTIVTATEYVWFSSVPPIPRESDIVQKAVEQNGLGFWEDRIDTLTAGIYQMLAGYVVTLVHIVWDEPNEREEDVNKKENDHVE